MFGIRHAEFYPNLYSEYDNRVPESESDVKKIKSYTPTNKLVFDVDLCDYPDIGAPNNNNSAIIGGFLCVKDKWEGQFSFEKFAIYDFHTGQELCQVTSDDIKYVEGPHSIFSTLSFPKGEEVTTYLPLIIPGEQVNFFRPFENPFSPPSSFFTDLDFDRGLEGVPKMYRNQTIEKFTEMSLSSKKMRFVIEMPVANEDLESDNLSEYQGFFQGKSTNEVRSSGVPDFRSQSTNKVRKEKYKLIVKIKQFVDYPTPTNVNDLASSNSGERRRL